MFNKLFRRNRAAASVAAEQQMLDTMRYNNAGDPLMQLHCDRMQVVLDASHSR